MRRAVITGMGLVTPLGIGIEENWERLLGGRSGIRAIEEFDVSDLPAKIAGVVPNGPTSEGLFTAEDWVEPKEQRKIDRFILLGMTAAAQAVEDSGWVPQTDEERNRTGVMIGSGIGGLQQIYDHSVKLHENGPRRISPFFIPAALINLISGQVSIRFGFKGPNHSVVTACSTGAHAIGDAARLVMLDDADVMIAGGAEAAVNRLGFGGFAAARALSTSFNDSPETASRPWDRDRDGFVMGEGSGVVVVEEYEHAKKRGAKILAEIVGYGMSGDAHHITKPTPHGARLAMARALTSSGLRPDDVAYVNAHATSTPLGDVSELDAIRHAFLSNDKLREPRHEKPLLVSSSKGTVGHMLGAAGATEAAIAALACRHRTAPPNTNLDDVGDIDETGGLSLVREAAALDGGCAVVTNSLGFGGTNTSLAFRAIFVS